MQNVSQVGQMNMLISKRQSGNKFPILDPGSFLTENLCNIVSAEDVRKIGQEKNVLAIP